MIAHQRHVFQRHCVIDGKPGPEMLFAEPLLILAGTGYKKPLIAIYDAFTQSSGAKVEAVFGNMQHMLLLRLGRL